MAGEDSPLPVHRTDLLIGDAPAVQALREHVLRLAAFDGVGNPNVPTLLLRGETGTGKNLIARIVHQSGPRAEGPFVDLNCAAIPETLLEAELFGFEAGAFTDARRAKPGLCEAAAGGILFLDEIDALPLILQSKLLTMIEEKRVRRLGSVGDRRVDVKVIAATKADLGRDVAEGRFRSDLYHRLAVVVLHLPPLRERGEDRLLLARHFLHRHAEAHGVAPKRLSPDGEAWVLGYAWPGNARELSHVMERAILLGAETALGAEVLERLCREALPATKAPPPAIPDESREEAERIREALARTGGNVVSAARLLGMSRNALRYRIRRYGIERPAWARGVMGDLPARGGSAADRTAGAGPGSARAAALPPRTAMPSGPVAPRRGYVVGRQREIEELEASLTTALEGSRQFVFVTGEPGIGKTTLLEIFLGSLGTTGTLCVARGQCVEQYGAGEAYLPVLEAVERACRAAEGDRLVEVLRRHAPSWLTQMPSLIPPGQRDKLQRGLAGATQERMLREMATALEAFTGGTALVLLLEDLQWSDASTLSLLSLLARRTERARLLVVGTFRSADVLFADHPLWSLKQELELHGLCREIPLQFLSEAHVAEYLTARFGGAGLPAGFATLVHRRTDGNPLFMTNVIDYLVANGAIVESHGGWDLHSAVTEVHRGVPQNIQELIERQIDRLAGLDQRILEAASVAGAEFSAAAVAAGLGMVLGEVEERCADLARRGRFMRPAGTAEWPDGTVAARFGFRHAIYQEVLHERVPAGRRVELHRTIGRRQEEAYGGAAFEIAAELAAHFERGREPDRAVRFHRLAGENALRRSAHMEAIDHLTKGLALLRALPDGAQRDSEEISLHIPLGPAWMITKGYAAPEVGRTYTRLLELGRQQGDAPVILRALRGLWSYHLVRADLHRARELAEEVLTLAQSRRDPEALVQAHAAMGETLFHLGEFGAARVHLEAAIGGDGQERSLRSAPQVPRVASYSAWALWLLGYPDQALRRMEEALAVAREMARPHDLAFALGFAVWLQQFRRDVRVTKDLAQEEMALCREYGFSYWLSWGMMLEGWALAEGGEGEGIDRMRAGLAAYKATGAEVGLTHFLAAFAEACGQAGWIEEGLAVLGEALGLMKRNDNRYYEPEVYRLQGELLLRAPGGQGGAGLAGRAAASEAEACFRQAIDVARRQQARSLELRAVVSVSRLWQSQRRNVEAREALAEILGRFTEGLDTADLREAKRLLDLLG